jgi:hypothetical protein
MTKHLGVRFIYQDEENDASVQNMPADSSDSVDFEKVKAPAELMTFLNKEILSSCQSLKNVMIMSDIKRFGEQIEALAKKHKIGYLCRYGGAIITYVDNFDTVGIEVKLDELSDIIKRLNQMREEFDAK